jgi:hypothetical protein
VLNAHAHGHGFEVAKDELLKGRRALSSPPYGETLTARGWSVLAIDPFGGSAGDRRPSSAHAASCARGKA